MRRILLVAPDPLIAEFIEKGLRARHFETAVAEEVPDTPAAFESFDLIVLDDRIVGHADPRLMAALAAETQTPLVVLTGNGRTADTVAALGDTAADIVTKPFRFRALVALIERRLGRSGDRPPPAILPGTRPPAGGGAGGRCPL